MAIYNNPKTGKSVEAANRKDALSKMAPKPKSTPKPKLSKAKKDEE